MAFIETTKRGRTVYLVRWNYRDKSIDGKPYDQRQFVNKREALAWHRKVAAEPATIAGTLTVAQVWQRFLDGPVRDLPVSTQRDYEQVGRLHLIPGLGRERADRLMPQKAAVWRNTLRQRGYASLGPERKPGDDRPRAKRPARPVSAPTVNKVIRIVRSGFRWARGEGLTSCMVFEDLRGVKDRRPPEERRPEPYAYDHDQLEALRKACLTIMQRSIIDGVADSGLRRGEAFALCRDCIELDGDEDVWIHVRRALDKDGKFKQPKTYERRSILVLDDGARAIREWLAVGGFTTDYVPDDRFELFAADAELVWRNEDGTSLNTTWDSGHAGQRKRVPGTDDEWYVTPGIRSRSGIWVRMSELRDTFVLTIMLSGATDIEVTATIGHESVDTTRRHYFKFRKVAQHALRDRANAKRRELRDLVRASRTA